MLLTYYLNEARSAALMLPLLIINFGAFHLNLFQLAGLSSLAIITFALVIYFLHSNYPNLLRRRESSQNAYAPRLRERVPLKLTRRLG